MYLVGMQNKNRPVIPSWFPDKTIREQVYTEYIKTVAKVVEGEFREICEQIGAKTELYLGIRQPPFPLMGV